MRVVGDVAYLLPVGGIEICTLEDTAALAARGHRVDLFFGLEGEQRRLFEQAGVGLHGPVSFKLTRRTPIRDLLGFLPAIRTVRRLKPDVIWLSRAEHVVWARLLAFAAGVELVTHLHHAPSSPRTRWLTKGVARFLAVSEFTRQQWIAAGVPGDRIEVVHNALPPGRYPVGGEEEQRAARASLGLPTTGRVITFYGRFSEEKGLPTVLEAFRRIERDDVHLLLAGFYPPQVDTSEVRRAVESLDPARVTVVGPESDVIPFLHAADVVVTPSWVDEAFGRTIVEGMSTGRPVIGARVGAVPELLEGGMERLLVPKQDADALLVAIEAVIDWRDAEPELGARCSAWVEERFPYAQHLERVESVLQHFVRG
ncbi:glycosyltransferase family 4 protein [Amnibacterium kyonggiense]|uniref:Glycosyltransferase involved in cell wall biosynthesis n=1 Tax=Amnibacterium kyonggiense TaxID=595671 RepID=A0A4R7FEM1_9MICO|nr:glycosyltransferase family 4 protein [Amnibacterium kyonggiense]TDS74886.1 glycosyltransferase involved in cell wall biosynthesis [Amnibacterium kyonggiense]